MKKSPWYYPLLAAAGLLAGALNGLLGAGGGILLTYTLALIFRRAAEDAEIERRDIFANALCVMLPVSAVSALVYFLRGNVAPDAKTFLFAVPGALGGLLGAYLLGKLDVRVVKLIFSLLVIYSGIRMIFV